MTSSAWVCEHPRHQGDRQIAHPADRYQGRLEFRRADAQDRPHSKAFINICRRCMNTYSWPAVERMREIDLAAFFVRIEYQAPSKIEAVQEGFL